MKYIIIYQLHDREVFHFESRRRLLDENISPSHTYKIEIDIPAHICKYTQLGEVILLSDTILI